MDSNTYQSLSEAYQSILDSQENLQELDSAYLGGTLSANKKSVTVGASKGGTGATVEVGSVKSKDIDSASKAAVSNAVSDYKRSQGDTTAAAKVSEPKAKSQSYAIPKAINIPGVTSPKPKPKPAAKPTPTGGTPRPDGKKVIPIKKPDRPVPTDVKKLEPVRVRKPSIEFSRKPEPSKDFGRGRDTMRMETTSDLDTYNLVLEAAYMWVEACIAYGIDFSEYTLDELTEAFIADMSSEELSESVLNEILGMPDAQNLGATLRKQYGKARRAVGDVAGATNQGYIGQKTTSKNPLARAGNQFTRNLSAVPRAAASFGAGFLTGKSGVTKEGIDLYDLVKGYLLDEGFASTEQSADKIILNMSEAWFADIMELTGGKGHPGYKAGSKDHGDLEDHPAVKKGGVLSPRYGNHLGDMDDEDEDEDDLESVVKQQSRDSRERTRKPLRDKVKAARKKMTKEELDQLELIGEEESDRLKDKHLERGGMAARSRYDRPPAKKLTNAELGIDPNAKTAAQKEAEEKYGKGATAMDIVMTQIRAKHGKDAIKDVSKKKKGKKD